MHNAYDEIYISVVVAAPAVVLIAMRMHVLYEISCTEDTLHVSYRQNSFYQAC